MESNVSTANIVNLSPTVTHQLDHFHLTLMNITVFPSVTWCLTQPTERAWT